MSYVRTSGSIQNQVTFKQQLDAAIVQANPVSTTLYEVLPTTNNVKIISISAEIDWGITQPTPLEIVMTIDGITTIFSQTNPVTGTIYSPFRTVYDTEAGQLMNSDIDSALRTTFPIEGGTVRVQIRITWAVTQPTPLKCRVKYAKR